MCLKTPSFWYETKAPMALLPLACAYNALRKVKTASTKTTKAAIPVLCIGNLTAGGSGKTPAARALVKAIKELKIAAKPCFLTRGYGGRLGGPLLVDSASHTYNDIGDEALLLSREAPVIVARNRPAGAALAAAKGFDLIIMDDGFQNPSLYKDKSLVVIDGITAFGNRALLPAGPLREPIKEGLARANGVILIGEDKRDVLKDIPKDIPIFKAALKPRAIPDKSRRYFAFCGIGQPEKFRKTLDESGLDLVGFRSFPDHHDYKKAELDNLLLQAKQSSATLITTSKDAVRLPHGFKVEILDVELLFTEPSQLRSWLAGLTT